MAAPFYIHLSNAAPKCSEPVAPKCDRSFSYMDFVPKLLHGKPNVSKISLCGTTCDTLFESFQHLVVRCNEWLCSNPEARVISCETIINEGWFDTTGGDHLRFNRKISVVCLTSYITSLRIWIRWSKDAPVGDIGGRPRACQIAYKDIVPAKVAINTKTNGYRYENLSAALKNFNQKLADGNEDTPGKIFWVETCTIPFYQSYNTLDTGRTFWVSPQKAEIHCLHFLRMFFFYGPSEIFELGFADFPPAFIGDSPRQMKFEQFPIMMSRAIQWCNLNQDLSLLNIQTFELTNYVNLTKTDVTLNDAALDVSQCMLRYGETVSHTKLLRTYCLRRAVEMESTQSLLRAHLKYKTFHARLPSLPPCLYIQDKMDYIMPHRQMQEATNRIATWLLERKAVRVIGVETVRLPTEAARKKGYISGENCYYESIAGQPLPVIHAIRLYIDGDSTVLNKKDLQPDPPTIQLTNSTCVIL